jgi:hypothetical protein
MDPACTVPNCFQNVYCSHCVAAQTRRNRTPNPHDVLEVRGLESARFHDHATPSRFVFHSGAEARPCWAPLAFVLRRRGLYLHRSVPRGEATGRADHYAAP